MNSVVEYLKNVKAGQNKIKTKSTKLGGHKQR